MLSLPSPAGCRISLLVVHSERHEVATRRGLFRSTSCCVHDLGRSRFKCPSSTCFPRRKLLFVNRTCNITYGRIEQTRRSSHAWMLHSVFDRHLTCILKIKTYVQANTRSVISYTIMQETSWAAGLTVSPSWTMTAPLACLPMRPVSIFITRPPTCPDNDFLNNAGSVCYSLYFWKGENIQKNIVKCI